MSNCKTINKNYKEIQKEGVVITVTYYCKQYKCLHGTYKTNAQSLCDCCGKANYNRILDLKSVERKGK